MAGGISHDPPCPNRACAPHPLHRYPCDWCGCTDGWPTEDSDGSVVTEA